MLQNKFEMPLDLTVNSSKILYIYFIFVFLFSLISVLISGIPLKFQILLGMLLCLVSLHFLKYQSKNKITSIKLNQADEWEIEINNNCSHKVELYGECIVTYFLVWLNFTTFNEIGKKKKFNLLLLPDSADKNLLRQLRVRLRFLSLIDKDEENERM